MKDEKITEVIAQELGWSWVDDWYWRSPHGAKHEFPPDYANDLNAMHEAEKSLNPDQTYDYGQFLARLTIGDEFDDEGFTPNGFGYFAVVRATARQRAEAFLKTVGKWRGQ